MVATLSPDVTRLHMTILPMNLKKQVSFKKEVDVMVNDLVF